MHKQHLRSKAPEKKCSENDFEFLYLHSDERSHVMGAEHNLMEVDHPAN